MSSRIVPREWQNVGRCSEVLLRGREALPSRAARASSRSLVGKRMGTEVEDLIAGVMARKARGEQPAALCVLADGRLANGDTDGALVCFDAALRIDAEVASAWVGRATILAGRGRAGEALGCVNRAL